MRPKTFWVAAIPVLCGTAFAMAANGQFNFWTFLLTLCGAISIQAMSNMQNDYGYNVRKAENGTRTGLPRATTEGWISMKNAKRMIQFMILLCCIFGAVLIAIGGWPIALIVVLSVLCAYIYMGGPLPIAYTPFGELLVLIFYGWVAVGGTYWLQTHIWNWNILWFGTALGLLGAAVLLVNNYRDVDHDRSVGRKTLVAVAGSTNSVYIYYAMIFLPFVLAGWMIIGKEYFWPVLFVLLALPKASFLPMALKKAQGVKVNGIMFATIKLEIQFGLLLALGLLAVAFMTWPLDTFTSNIFRIPF
jgi:1,4-dihydroxy-2-naphthoate octaprenyltransferase